MKIFFSEQQLKYDPKREFTGKDFRQYSEKPDRVNWILDAIKQDNNDEISLINPILCDINKISNVHDIGYVDFLKNLPHDIEEQVPMTLAPENGKVIPSIHSPFDIKFGYYFFSVDTPITPHAFSSSRYSVSSALDCVSEILRNDNVSIGLSRPPGHHAMFSKGGGFCFFNNIAIAAQEAVDHGKSVSILDLDFHHGNGTQEIFYNTSKVQYVSLHAKEAYPYYWGNENEVGIEEGLNFNHNYPLANTTNSEQYDQVLSNAIKEINDYSPDIILVSMGFDCYYKDPIAGMEIKETYYKNIGNHLSKFQKVGIILEGGYSEDIGTCFVNLLNGLL